LTVCYVVQRTFPEPLTGSEIYIHELERGMSNFQNTYILATSRLISSINQSGYLEKGNVYVYKESPSWMITGPLIDILRKDKSGKLLHFYAGLMDGFFHSISWGHYSRALQKHLYRGDFDIIHSAAVTDATVWCGWKAAVRTGKHFVVTPFMHTNSSDYLFPYVTRMLADASAVIAMTEYEKDMISNMGVDDSKIHVIPIGIDPSRYATENASDFRSSHNIGPNDFVVLVPRKSEDKGFYQTMDALFALPPLSRKIALVMLDKTPVTARGKIESYKSALVKKGINVVDTGYVTGTDLVSALRSADVIVQPSRVDSLGIIYLESWACKKPVIAACSGSMKEVIKDHENGLLVEYGSVKQIADALMNIANDEKLGATLGINGFQLLNQKYTYREMVNRTRDLYSALLSNQG
jgi:glycogen(starch) synthase